MNVIFYLPLSKMSKNSFKRFGLFFLFVILLGIPVSGNADSSIATTGKSVQASITFRVIIPAVISLQVGDITAPDQTKLSKNIEKISLTTSRSGQYFHIYSNQNITPQQTQGGPRLYILCSP
ncbi:MAG: hypothetical protein JRF32_00920 [Deltaproteobacteria bacterium]|nr:hypothetical protein [Deltaproteobacteria bacterium]MBW2296158.1 hypothetical protein [Deltaproteobacteria bacterium]